MNSKHHPFFWEQHHPATCLNTLAPRYAVTEYKRPRTQPVMNFDGLALNDLIIFAAQIHNPLMAPKRF